MRKDIVDGIWVPSNLTATFYFPYPAHPHRAPSVEERQIVSITITDVLASTVRKLSGAPLPLPPPQTQTMKTTFIKSQRKLSTDSTDRMIDPIEFEPKELSERELREKKFFEEQQANKEAERRQREEEDSKLSPFEREKKEREEREKKEHDAKKKEHNQRAMAAVAGGRGKSLGRSLGGGRSRGRGRGRGAGSTQSLFKIKKRPEPVETTIVESQNMSSPTASLESPSDSVSSNGGCEKRPSLSNSPKKRTSLERRLSRPDGSRDMNRLSFQGTPSPRSSLKERSPSTRGSLTKKESFKQTSPANSPANSPVHSSVHSGATGNPLRPPEPPAASKESGNGMSEREAQFFKEQQSIKIASAQALADDLAKLSPFEREKREEEEKEKKEHEIKKKAHLKRLTMGATGGKKPLLGGGRGRGRGGGRGRGSRMTMPPNL